MQISYVRYVCMDDLLYCASIIYQLRIKCKFIDNENYIKNKNLNVDCAHIKTEAHSQYLYASGCRHLPLLYLVLLYVAAMKGALIYFVASEANLL